MDLYKVVTIDRQCCAASQQADVFAMVPEVDPPQRRSLDAIERRRFAAGITDFLLHTSAELTAYRKAELAISASHHIRLALIAH
jgi:hypothetical protein